MANDLGGRELGLSICLLFCTFCATINFHLLHSPADVECVWTFGASFVTLGLLFIEFVMTAADVNKEEKNQKKGIR